MMGTRALLANGLLEHDPKRRFPKPIGTTLSETGLVEGVSYSRFARHSQ
jgi:hypothetical protein